MGGAAYPDVVRENVFVPAGMTETVVDDRFAIIKRTRFYHRDSTGAVVNAEFLDASYTVPGGGWLLSATDLARFDSALFHDKLMRRSTRTWGTGAVNKGPALLSYSSARALALVASGTVCPVRREGVAPSC